MGNYAVAADVQERFADAIEGSYVTDNESAKTWDTNRVNDAIVWAEAQINSKIGQRYATPVSAANLAANTEAAALLKYMTVEIAEIHLLRRGSSLSDEKRKQLEEAMAMLDDIRDGKATIPGATTLPSTTSREPRTSWSAADRTLPADSPRIFTRTTAGRI